MATQQPRNDEHCRLAPTSAAGVAWDRTSEPLIPNHQPGQPPFGSIWARGMLVKDGRTFLESNGYFGEFQTAPFSLLDGKLTINADARIGAIYYEVVGKDVPEQLYSMENCVPLMLDDQVTFPLRFGNRRDLSELVGQEVYLRFKMKGARFYSLRGDFNFDIEDRYRKAAGLPLSVPSYLF